MSDLVGTFSSLGNYHLPQAFSSPVNPSTNLLQVGLSGSLVSEPRMLSDILEHSDGNVSSAAGSPRSRSSFPDDHLRGVIRRTPKDTECAHCHKYFTARGVKLHAQRCSQKRATDVALMIETSTKEVNTNAQAEKELYESIIRQMRDEMNSVQGTLQNTVHSLELTRRDHRISLEYADAVAVELVAARSEIMRLGQIVDFTLRSAKVSNEMDESVARLLSQSSSD